MALLIRSHHWETTPLGPMKDWPRGLRSLVETILAAPFPHAVAWGPEQTMIYNDAYRPLLGARPEALGRPFMEVWAEAREHVEPLVESALSGGAGVLPDACLAVVRDGRTEEAFFDFSFSPLRDDAGGIAGFLTMGAETTRRVRSDRTARDSELRLAAVLEQMPVGVAIAAVPTGELLLHNTKGVDIIGHPLLTSPDYSGYVRYGALHADGAPYRPEEYPIARAAVQGLTVDREIMRYRRGDGSVTWLEVSAAPILDHAGKAVLAVSTFEDIAERMAREEALRDSEQRLRENERRMRTLVEGIPQLVWRAATDGARTWSSPQWTSFTGLTAEESRGRGWLAALHPDDRQRALMAWERSRATGGFVLEHRIGPASGHGWRWFRAEMRPVRDDSGAIVEWLGTATDIDDLRRMRDQQEVMVAELQHRTRNLLAIVQSIAQQTAALAPSSTDFAVQFADRLAALSRVQGLLSSAEQEPVTIDTLIRMELDALGASLAGGRVTVEGPPTPLRSRTVQTFALALHELATNACKHGALSTPDGRLSVTWRVIHDGDDGPTMDLDWTESGVVVPASARQEDSRRGYGRRLIERALPFSLDARTRFDLTQDGLRCTITLPLSRRGETEIIG